MAPPANPVSLAPAAAIGAACGSRTFVALAVLAWRGRWGDGLVGRVLPVLSGGELIADKLPATRSRTEPPALAGRIAAGAACGAVVAGAPGAILAAAVATVTTFALQRGRAALGRRTGIADPLLGALEDAVAISLAVWSTRHLSGPPAAHR
jgi:uncharacterized membrane protein